MTPTEILDAYSARVITRHEVIAHFIEAASEIAPEQILALMPSDLLPQLRLEVATPPTSPEALMFVHAGVPRRYESEEIERAAAARTEANQRLARERYFKGARALHAYFYSSQKLT